MANTIKIKRSAVQGKVPVVGDLSLGELALNTYDGKLYTLKNDGTAAVVEIGVSGGGSFLSSSTASEQAGYFGNIYLKDDSNPSHYLEITNSADLTALRTLSINVNDANRSVTLAGNLSLANSLTTSGNFALTLTTTGATNVTLPTSGTLAVNDQTMNIGTTAVAINRASASLALTGITSIDGSAATLTTSRTLWGQSFNGGGNVSGNLTAVGNITGTGAVALTATGAALDLVATGANLVSITTNGAERVRVDSSGNLGVGAVAPSFKADIAGDARVTSTNKMRFGGTAGTTNFYIQYNSTANSLDFVAG